MVEREGERERESDREIVFVCVCVCGGNVPFCVYYRRLFLFSQPNYRGAGRAAARNGVKFTTPVFFCFFITLLDTHSSLKY